MKLKYFMFGGQNPTEGVYKKLFSQVSELRRLGLDVELVIVHDEGVRYPPYNFLTTYTTDPIPVNDILGRIKRARKISRIFGETVNSLGSDEVLYLQISQPVPSIFPEELPQAVESLQSCDGAPDKGAG